MNNFLYSENSCTNNNTDSVYISDIREIEHLFFRIYIKEGRELRASLSRVLQRREQFAAISAQTILSYICNVHFVCLCVCVFDCLFDVLLYDPFDSYGRVGILPSFSKTSTQQHTAVYQQRMIMSSETCYKVNNYGI